MPSLFHSDEISAVLNELKITLQQSTVTIAAIQEVTTDTSNKLDRLTTQASAAIEKLDTLLNKANRVADLITNAGKS